MFREAKKFLRVVLVVWLTAFAAAAQEKIERPGRVLTIEPGSGGVILRCETGAVELAQVGPGVVRVLADRSGNLAPVRSYALADLAPAVSGLEVDESGQGLRLKGDGILIQINRDPLQLVFLDGDGRPLHRDAEPGGLGWRGEEVLVTKQMPETEHYYGFGEKTGPLDKRGLAMEMWNRDQPYSGDLDPLYQSHPFFLALNRGRAYGIFFDNSFHSYFDMGRSDSSTYTFRAAGGPLRYYFIYGPEPKDVIRRYTNLVGRMPLPPLWALGYQQSRWSYENEKRVREIASGFRSRGIPGDVLFLDIHYLDRYKVFTWNRRRFPDPAGLLADLGQKGFKVVTIIDPGVKVQPGYFVYDQGVAKGYFCRRPDGSDYRARVWPGDCSYPDFLRPEVRVWWGDLHRVLLDPGVAGIWNDMNEPSGWKHDVRAGGLMLSLSPIREMDMVHGPADAPVPHAEVHNVYGLLESRGTYEGLRRLKPEERPFVISRAGFPGIQRYACVWTGDNYSNWNQLPLSLTMLLNLGLSGLTFVGADIGGFVGSPSPELYARWIQQGAFYPFARTHTMILSGDQEPWSFGPEVEAIAKEVIGLRYQLLPYFYALFEESSRTGLPVMRPLLLEFPRDETAYTISDQFLIGPDLLFAPVVEKGARSRRVYLPEGRWVSWKEGKVYPGPGWIEAATALDTLPLWVREGAIIPLAPVMPHTGAKPWDPLSLRIYPGAGESSFTWYEDDQKSFAYEQGQWRRTTATVRPAADALVFQIAAPLGAYTPAARSFRLEFYGLAAVAAVTPAAGGPGLEWVYDASRRVLIVQMPDRGQAEILTIAYK